MGLSGEARKNEEVQIIKETALFSGANYFSQALLTVRGLIIANVLGPALYGVWSIYRTFFSSAHFLSLGTSSAMLRQVPLEQGKGNYSIKEKLQQSTFTWNLIACGSVSLLLIIISIFAAHHDRRLEFILAASAFFLNAFKIFVPFKLNSEGRIFELSKFSISYAVLNTVFGLSLLFAYKINGILIALILTNVILLIIMCIKGQFSLRLDLDLTVIKKLIQIGFPIMILYMAFFLMAHIDKFVVYFMLGKTMTGYYGLAAFISQIIHYIPYAITMVLMPRMMYKYGRTGEKEEIEEYFTTPILLLSGFLPVIFGLIFIDIRSVIIYLLPEYEPALHVLRILLIGLFFGALWKVPTDVLIAFNKQKRLLYFIITLLMLGTTTDVALVHFGYGITGVAFATAVIFYLASMTTNVYALRSLGKSWKIFVVTLFKIHVPVVYVSTGLFFIMRYIATEHVIITDIIRTITFCVYVIPLIYYVNSKIRIIEKIGEIIFVKPTRSFPVEDNGTME